MARINNYKRYPVKQKPKKEDTVIGTCSETGKTMNFKVCDPCNQSSGGNDNGGETQELMVYSFQFNDFDLTSNINSESIDNESFINSNGNLRNVNSLELGENIVFDRTSRFGFIIKNSDENEYSIFDFFNQNVTDIVFNKRYDSETRTLYFVSKEYIVPSTLYYKFVKN